MLRRSLVLSLVVFGISPSAIAHDIWGMANPVLNDPEILPADELASFASQQQAGSKERYVLERTLLWAPGVSLRTCFLDGTANERAKAEGAIRDLKLKERGVNIDFQFTGSCQGNTPEEVRISFINGCCFAYVGRTALHPKLKGRPTVYLQGGLPTYIIQHEILHTLGVHHEHQNPSGSNCYARLVDVASYAQFNGWDIATVKGNLQIFGKDQKRFIWSEDRDEKSLTHYHIDANFLQGGEGDPCYVGTNVTLSTGDIEGLRKAYPTGQDAAKAAKDASDGLASLKISLPQRIATFISALPQP